MNILNEVRIDSDENSVSSLASSNKTNLEKTKSSQEIASEGLCSKSLSIDNEPFYFETDTLALRNNQDYSCLLKTLILLEGQRIKACNDLEKLIELKDEAMSDPVNFVNKLNQNNAKSSNIPARQKVYVLPEIDWNKYYDGVDLEDLEAIKNQKINRVQSLRQTTKLIQQIESSGVEGANSLPTRSSTRKKQKNLKTKKKIKNYNKSWSNEEQRHLEELLIEFPPEDNEAARWRKIANKLGTRSPLQVQSHCQKYFIKLAKAGLPIPGRMPNLKTYVTKKGNRGKGKSSFMRGYCSSGIGSGRAKLAGVNNTGKRMVGRGVNLNEISSMWTSFNPPITMNDENEMDDEYENDYENYNQNYEDNENQSDLSESYYQNDDDDDENDDDNEESLNNSNSNSNSNFSKTNFN